jgi:hypothetical protein
MAKVMIVDSGQLANTPKAFQQYVSDYFRVRTVLGKKVWWATIKLDVDMYDRVVRAPMAPCHSLHLQHYKDGLAKNQDLGDWISKAEGKYLWTFEGGFDSDNVVRDY